MPVRLDVISIGTLSRNRLWNESKALRTPHATTLLVRAGERGSNTRERRILVDPGLPGPALAARLFERTGLLPADVDVVFLTSFRPSHRGGLALFPDADWLLHGPERDAVREHLTDLADRGDAEVRGIVRRELAVLDRTRELEGDKLAEQVDLFPLPGYTPGTCGLLVAEAASTTLIAGDAVPTRDHLLAAQVLPDAHDPDAAREAMREVYEIADVVVPGHDNLFLNPRSYGG